MKTINILTEPETVPETQTKEQEMICIIISNNLLATSICNPPTRQSDINFLIKGNNTSCYIVSVPVELGAKVINCCFDVLETNREQTFLLGKSKRKLIFNNKSI